MSKYSFRSPAGMQPNAPGSLPGPDDISRVELPNGIVVLSRSNFNSPSVVISGYLNAGSLFEPDNLLGLANFTSLGLMRGTARRSFHEIYDALESVGASLGFSGGTHSTGFSGRSLTEDLDMLLGLLAEALRQPAFPPEPIERLRSQLLTGLAIRAQDTGEMASLAFDKIVYNAHPYSRPEDGYPETVQAIRIEDIETFHRRFYGPREMVIAVVGAVDTREAVDKISHFLGDWSNPDQPTAPGLPPVRPLENLVRQSITIPGKSQADILIGSAGPQRLSPDFLAASLGNSVLGQFGMFGRIGDVVREQAGLAYYAYSSLSGGIGPGPWYVTSGVDPANVDRAVELIRLEIARFVDEPVSKDELDDSKANYIGRLPLSLESNGGVAGALLNLERYQLGLDYYRRYPGLISGITREDVLAAARHYLHPNRLAIAVGGP
ncbi:MAG: insulinase family protein [Chloroflexota bacterium]|nr:MAG: insulinase family protein [Chloroflexota bacterium]